jgi:hypothetical protein
VDFVEKFRERVGTLQGFLVSANFKACANLSTDLLRVSDFASFPEGIFIGEFLESLFSNIRSLNARYDIEKDDIQKIQEATSPCINFVSSNIPFSNKNKKAEFYDLMVKARSTVTGIQIVYFREKKTKSPLMPMPIPMPFRQTIEVEPDNSM